MSLGRRCAQEEDVLRKKTCLEGDVPSKRTSLGRCHPQRVVPGKKVSLGRYHLLEEISPTSMSLGRCHPQGGVSGKVSGRGCPWEDVILRKEMCLTRCLQEDTVLGKMFPGSRHIWEGDVPRKETSLGRCHPLEGDLPRMAVPGPASPAGMHHWEKDVPGKKTSLRKEIFPFKQPKPMEPQQ